MGHNKLSAAGAIFSLMLMTGPASYPAAAARGTDSAIAPSPLSTSLCRLGFASIPMTSLPSGHHMVKVSVNGRAGSFLVDTGAGVTIVHAPYLKSFGLSAAAGGRAAGTLTGVVQVTPVDVTRFAISNTNTQLSRIYAMDLSHIVKAIKATTQQPIQGLIGQDVMRNQKAIIDVERSVLYLKTVDELEAVTGPCDEDARQPETAAAQARNGVALDTRADGFAVKRGAPVRAENDPSPSEHSSGTTSASAAMAPWRR